MEQFGIVSCSGYFKIETVDAIKSKLLLVCVTFLFMH